MIKHTLSVTTLSIIITSIFWLWLIDRNLESVGAFYDIYWNSASGWICTTHEPPEAHPEMRFNWSTFKLNTHVVCHGQHIDFENLLDKKKES